jgi:FkbM family methyltransferase
MTNIKEQSALYSVEGSISYQTKQTFRWLFVFTEGLRLTDKVVLFPGSIFRLASFGFRNIRIPILPQLFTFLARPICEVIVSNRHGKYICRKAADDVLIAAQAYETSLQAIFESINSGVFVDIGANIGKYTIKVAKQLEGVGKVVAIEPHKNTFSVLERNTSLNNLANVIPINAACWNKNGELDLYSGTLFETFVTSGSHSVAQKFSSSPMKVRSAKLDDILREVGISKVDFIKIDVEGAEPEVLEGAVETIKNSNNIKILFEALNEEGFKRSLEILEKHKLVVRTVSKHNYLAAR